ncbi:Protein lunapark [Grifola frondosa]|uniref:Endoplasmic reticulum junction formation protein lunapark n=1 Tax=Grifola frondosa TaxID=5627 RepID=A0A1C7LY22_GRIFR|nr:Protein lunapark [Grifola frondosa]
MGLFSRWFRKNQPEDYEELLATLALDIQKRQTRLSEIRLRERRSTLLFSVYALALWLAYTSLWYTNLLPKLTSHSRNSNFERTAEAVPVFVGPIVILFIRRIVQIWYTRIGDGEEKALVKVRNRQREKVEEFKAKTNYYLARNLIERYEDAGWSSSNASARADGEYSATHTCFDHSKRSPVPNTITTTPLPPPRKQWFDKLADAILGDDDASGAGAASRFALICQKCFAHNGLVKESMWEDTQYVCPKCGHFNPSARAVREARIGEKSRSPDAARVRRASPVSPQGQIGQTLAPPLAAPFDVESDGSGASPRREGPDADGSMSEGHSVRMEVDSS